MNDNNDDKNNKNKEEWNRKYTLIAIYFFIVIVASFAVILIIMGVRDYFALKQYLDFFKILTPIIYGLIFAYMLNPLLLFFQKKIFYKLGPKTKNTLSIISTYLTMAVIITLILLMVIPQVILSVQQLTGKATNWLSPYETGETEEMTGGEEESESESGIKTGDESGVEADGETGETEEMTGGEEENGIGGDLANSKIGVYLRDLGVTIQDYIDGMGLKIDVEETFNNMADNVVNILSAYIIDALNATLAVLYGMFSSILNIIIGILISVYLLISKDKFIAQVKKLFFAFFPANFSYRVVKILRKTHEIFGGFINGKILDSAIMGVICFIVMAIFRINYAPLISVIVAVSNIIPFFGPIIGGIIGVLFLAINDIGEAFLFTVIILILQQFDGNVLGPKILGSKLGLPAFWVIVAIIVMGGLFNLPGILFGVPVLALVYVLLKEYVENRLVSKGFPPETEQYIRSPGSMDIEPAEYAKKMNKEIKNKDSKSIFFGKALHKTAKNIMGIFHLGKEAKNTKEAEKSGNEDDNKNIKH